MIKNTEIRVGNWLEWNKKPFKVCAIFRNVTENELWAKDNSELHPIQLTEEILMKNNFIIDDCKGFNVSDDDYYKVFSFNGFDIALIEETFYVWHELEDSYCNFYIHNKIEFVHQLQNAYFTNKAQELEINL